MILTMIINKNIVESTKDNILPDEQIDVKTT